MVCMHVYAQLCSESACAKRGRARGSGLLSVNMIWRKGCLVLGLLAFLALLGCSEARIHNLYVTNDDRRYIALTKFGFYQGGVLDVKLKHLKIPLEEKDNGIFGFSLDRTISNAMSPYLDSRCPLENTVNPPPVPQHPAIVYLKMNITRSRMEIICGKNVEMVHLYTNRSQISVDRSKRNSIMFLQRRKRDNLAVKDIDSKEVKYQSQEKIDSSICAGSSLPMTVEQKDGSMYIDTSFAMYVATSREEGFYNLYFHNCRSIPVEFVMEIYESNGGNFLSAGELPLPALYTMMSILFALTAFFWLFILRTSHHPVYKIHIIMCVLVFLKSLSLALHGVNYHFIQTRGEHVPVWAILYYITHLLKGALLFVTIVLVGTGWNFIKYILSDRDKNLFMIVIPLQVIANVAEIIIEESEEGAAEHNAWRYIFILVELLCCAAILFPVEWSIRHLQEVSSIDGKALVSLRKLKLFRHFYMMVLCYIYSTRIVAHILKISVAFQYSWLDEMFREMATFVFFVLTGYKFRPAAANPYFTPTHNDDIEPKVLTECPMYDGVSRLSKRGESREDKEDQQPLMHETHDYD